MKLTPFDIEQIQIKGSLHEALEIALQEIRRGSCDPQLFYLGARLAFELNDLAKAEQLVRALLAYDPEHINGWVLFGDINQRLGDNARAEYSRDRAIDLFPALEELDLSRDRKTSEPVISKSNLPPVPDLNFDTATFAEICIDQGYLNKALKIYSDLQRDDPQNAQWAAKIDEIKRKMGKHD